MRNILFFALFAISASSQAISLARYDRLPEEYKHVYVRALVDAHFALPIFGDDFKQCLLKLKVEGVQYEYKRFMNKEPVPEEFKELMDFPSMFNALTQDYCEEFVSEEERARVVEILGKPSL